MSQDIYLLDTHALLFWDTKAAVSDEFIAFLDNQERQSNILVSTIAFWEIALLVKKRKIEISDTQTWQDEILGNTNTRLVDPSPSEMIDSTLLPDHHKDPFDRLLISQANHHGALLVTKDETIRRYDVPTFWL